MAEDYRDMVTDLVQSYKAMGCNTTYVFKGAFLRLSLRLLPRKSLGAVRGAHGKRFQQDISDQGTASGTQYGVDDYCWTLRREVPQRKGSRE